MALFKSLTASPTTRPSSTTSSKVCSATPSLCSLSVTAATRDLALYLDFSASIVLSSEVLNDDSTLLKSRSSSEDSSLYVEVFLQSLNGRREARFAH